MNIKIIFSIVSVLVYFFAFFPYIKGIIKKETQPHEFTWLIWGITQGTATAGLWIGGGGMGVLPSVLATVLVIFVFFLSLRDGKRDVTRGDGVVLIFALLAIGAWWFLDNPFLALILVSIIDLSGYIPTFRKSYNHPWTEKVLSWALFTTANVFEILALQKYNFLTLSYVIAISSANLLLLLFLLTRRVSLPKPSLAS